MKIEVGKQYVTRNGIVTGYVEVDDIGDDDEFPFIARLSGVEQTFQENGRYSLNDADHPFDLVREYLPPTGKTRPLYKPLADAQDQAFKADSGKPQFDLLHQGCADALLGVVKVLTFAVTPPPAGKGYKPYSWQEVPDAVRRYRAALYRHLNAIERGETTDPESGLPHEYHVATNALFLAQFRSQEDA